MQQKRIRKLFQLKWLRRFQIDILASFVLILTLSFTLILLFYGLRIHRTIFQLSETLADDVTSTNILHISSLLDGMETNVKVATSLTHTSQEISLDNPTLIDFLSQLIRRYPAMQTFSFATTEGNMVQIYRLDKEQKMLTDPTRPVPEGSIYGLRQVVRSSTPMSETWIYLNQEGVALDKEVSLKTTYDPREREWYKAGALQKTFTWSDLYYSFSAKLLTFAAGSPLFNEKEEFFGVVATSLRLDVLSDFLAKHTFGTNGLQFILEREGNLIAAPNLNLEEMIQEKKRPITVWDFGNAPLREVFLRHSQTKEQKFTLSLADEDYLVAVTSIGSANLHWLLVLMAPLKDFLGPLLVTQQQAILFCLIIILLAIFLAIFTSKRISKPIIALTEEINKIKRFDLADDIRIHSNIKEISLIANALSSMKTALRSFGLFVPKQIVSHLITTGEEVHMGGHRKLVTLFFSDIYNFTSIGEKLSPEQLAKHLSEYLDELSRIIIVDKGTIDKYSGDNIMAFWGAPDSQHDHPLLACKAALHCQMHLDALNRKWQHEKKPELITRIGIHTGHAIIGNIGSSERLNYTAIGDAVNLASRMEGLNKLYHTRILISEETYDKVKDRCVARPLDIVTVKGKEEGIKIFELLGLLKSDAELAPSLEQKELCEQFSQAYTLYLTRHFGHSKKSFEGILALYPQDYPTQLYIKRCEELIKHPPGGHFNGVTHLSGTES